MPFIRSVRGKEPKFGNNCWIAQNATIVGDVTIGSDCSIWFNTVIRGDVNSIIIGNKVNIQDGVIVHCTYQKTKTYIGNNVSVGHNAIIHGCTIQDNVLVGMGSIIMDNAIVESHCLIAAGAVILEGTCCKSGYIYAGIPAKKVKKVSKEQFTGTIDRIATSYSMYASWYKEDS